MFLSDGVDVGEREGVSLAERAYRELRGRIIQCDIAPGDVVTEAKLAADLGLGQTPTREAVRRLVAEGFMTPKHRLGYEVTPMTVARVREIFEALRAFLPEVAVLAAARATRDERAKLEEITAALTRPDDGGHARDTQPFAFFFKLCRNPTIIEMTSGVLGHFERIGNFAFRCGTLVGGAHTAAREAALEAFEGADEDLIRRAYRALLDEIERTVVAALYATPSLSEAPVHIRPANPTNYPVKEGDR